MAEITWSGNGRSCAGYLADGSGGGKAPGVLVLHEGNGLSANTRSKCDALAAMGYVAFAVDMFAGSEGERDGDPGRAGEGQCRMARAAQHRA